MVAVLLVFANHLLDWPRGGFVGVDVFFVISGFLITGNLLRAAESTGTVSFRDFYWNRVRRIVPAATLVLLLTYLAAVMVFAPFRAGKVGVDALFAFIFMANWHFAIQDTNYFAASETVSPIQHYWSLSIEEQFYFVWPAVIFVISLVVVKKAWTHGERMRLAGCVMAGIVAASLGWAWYQSSAAPLWAYFDTFSRVWELGVGALLACSVGLLADLPPRMKSFISGAGLVLIAASVLLISEGSAGFPVPWALLPVVGTASVIAAGVGREPLQPLLQNRVATYIGDISYSLYLVHWPVIVILGTVMHADGLAFVVSAIALGFGLAIASFHFVENPLRRATWRKFTRGMKKVRDGEYAFNPATRYAAVAVAALLVLAVATYQLRPDAYKQTLPPSLAATSPSGIRTSPLGEQLGPLANALQLEIEEALQATSWPRLEPSIESVIRDDEVRAALPECSGVEMPDPSECAWGPATAKVTAVLLGNSVAVHYAIPFRDIALSAENQLNVYTMAMPGCNFTETMVYNADPGFVGACPGRKQAAVDYINRVQPDIVFISNNYTDKRILGTDRDMTSEEWNDSMRRFVDGFSDSVQKVVFLAPPPGDAIIEECYGSKSSTPADCIGSVDDSWASMARTEQDLAESIGATWIDSLPWFCSTTARLCPSFVGSTPTKKDRSHLVPAYGQKIHAVIAESLRKGGVL